MLAGLLHEAVTPLPTVAAKPCYRVLLEAPSANSPECTHDRNIQVYLKVMHVVYPENSPFGLDCPRTADHNLPQTACRHKKPRIHLCPFAQNTLCDQPYGRVCPGLEGLGQRAAIVPYRLRASGDRRRAGFPMPDRRRGHAFAVVMQALRRHGRRGDESVKWRRA